MITEIGSGRYAKLLGISVQGLHKRMRDHGEKRLYGLVSRKTVSGRLIFTVDTEQLKAGKKNSLKKVA
jgi:hypothetical protein